MTHDNNRGECCCAGKYPELEHHTKGSCWTDTSDHPTPTERKCTCDINGAEDDIGHFKGCPRYNKKFTVTKLKDEEPIVQSYSTPTEAIERMVIYYADNFDRSSETRVWLRETLQSLAVQEYNRGFTDGREASKEYD